MRAIVAVVGGIIRFCVRHAWLMVTIGALSMAASVNYAAHHFAMNTDINKLISPDLPWRKREVLLDRIFPKFDLIAVVVEAPTPELVNQATSTLMQRLTRQHELFRSITEPGGGEFFRQNALLFQSPEQLKPMLEGLAGAEPIIDAATSDPSLRGLTQMVSFALMSAQGGHVTLNDFERPFAAAADTLERLHAGDHVSFSWHNLVAGRPPRPDELRHVIVIRPVLDYQALEPGRAATDAIRQAAAALKLDSTHQATVRLTGPVPMADEEFGTIKENAALNGALTVLVVLFILWRALGSGRTILAVFISLAVGLALTAAVGLKLVGALNLISVYFAVLFVGLGVDFGIQFSVRYRAERHRVGDLRESLLEAGRRVAGPLTLAACATAAGFLSFVPTDYRGLSELGLIAGLGMLIAFATSVTLLPALLVIFKPPDEPQALGYPVLAPVDRFLDRRRIPILTVTLLAVVAGLPLLYWLRFDFNPINLRSQKTESIATYLELRNDPNSDANAIEVVTPSLQAADADAEKLRAVPEVARVTTLSSFIPQGQKQKLPIIQQAARQLEPALGPPEGTIPPSDSENVAALNATAQSLNRAAGNAQGPGAAAAKRLAGDLTLLARSDQAARTAAAAAFLPPLKTAVNDLRDLLHAHEVTLANITTDLRDQWAAPDGRARVEVAPKGDPNDNEVLRNFARAVLAVEPNAAAGPISILESSQTIISAFIHAGAYALLSITFLLWITLRRFGDVLLTLIPLLVAGVVTLELCVLLDFPLNYANIIALPLLLGVGVAFKIYYIMAWREGQTNLLQSVLTRAVMFSAATTATAFGSLWFSSHPGTSSMGKLLALSLVCTLAAAALFQPILMGKPREQADRTSI